MGVAVSNSVKLPTSDNVGSVTDESGMVANVEVAVAIGLRTHTVQLVISISGFGGRHLEFR